MRLQLSEMVYRLLFAFCCSHHERRGMTEFPTCPAPQPSRPQPAAYYAPLYLGFRRTSHDFALHSAPSPQCLSTCFCPGLYGFRLCSRRSRQTTHSTHSRQDIFLSSHHPCSLLPQAGVLVILCTPILCLGGFRKGCTAPSFSAVTKSSISKGPIKARKISRTKRTLGLAHEILDLAGREYSSTAPILLLV